MLDEEDSRARSHSNLALAPHGDKRHFSVAGLPLKSTATCLFVTGDTERIDVDLWPVCCVPAFNKTLPLCLGDPN